MWASSILAALKAIPMMVTVGRDIVASIKNLQDSITEKQIAEIKGKVSDLTTELEGAKTDEELKDILRRLNESISE